MSSPPTTSRTFLIHTLSPHRRQIGLLLLILLIGIALSVAAPFVASAFIDGIIGIATIRHLTMLALITMLLAFLAQGISLAETWSAESLSWDTTNSVRLRLIRHVLALDTRFHTSHTVGELIDRVDGDVSMLARFLSRFVVVVIGNSLLILTILGILLTINLAIAATLAAVVVITVIGLAAIRRRATPFWRAERDASARWYGELSEVLDGLEDIQAAGAAPWVLRRNTIVNRLWYAVTTRSQMMGYGMVASTVALLGIGTAAVLAIAVINARDGSMSIGEVYLVVMYALMLRTPVDQIRNEMQDFQQADASVQRVVQLMGQRSNLPDSGTDALPLGQQPIELQGVSFAWEPGSPVLEDITLTLGAGRITGIVGRTGSGKTTLTKLVSRMIDPDAGSVRIGGVNVRDVPLTAVRQRIGVMSQDVRIIHATLRDNLTWFDASVPDAVIIAALEEIGLGAWYRRLPNGLETWLGSGGVPLSAGEAQLLACTRMLLRDPEIVILDEASSRLDPATERRLHTAFARVLNGRTALVIAHRLETMALADDIIVMESGRVVEQGARADLISDPHSRLHHMIAQSTTEAQP